jgi:hypothetical protein
MRYNSTVAKKSPQSRADKSLPADHKPEAPALDADIIRSPVNGAPLPVDKMWKPGQSGNPGGAPKGKRLSTWLAEFGQEDLTLEQIDRKLAAPGLPLNARMALKQIRRAAYEDDGLPAAMWAADRVEGGIDRTVHLTHKQEPTMSPDEAAKIIKASEDARKLGEF